MPRELPTKFFALVFAALLVGNLFAAHTLFRRPSLSVFAAGKGTASLLEASGGRILIDAGSDASVLRALGNLLPPWSRRLDAVMLTSDKAAAGLLAVKERYAVGWVLRFGVDVPYGSKMAIGTAVLVIDAPGRYRIGALAVSSTTPRGTYTKW